MDFLSKLEKLMKDNDIKNLNQLSEKSGIPYTTVRSWYDGDRSADNIRLATLEKLKTVFGCTLDYLVINEITDPYNVEHIEENEYDNRVKELETDNIKIIVGKNASLTKEGYMKIQELLLDEIQKNNE